MERYYCCCCEILASFPGLPTIQFWIAYSRQKPYHKQSVPVGCVWGLNWPLERHGCVVCISRLTQIEIYSSCCSEISSGFPTNQFMIAYSIAISNQYLWGVWGGCRGCNSHYWPLERGGCFSLVTLQKPGVAIIKRWLPQQWSHNRFHCAWEKWIVALLRKNDSLILCQAIFTLTDDS